MEDDDKVHLSFEDGTTAVAHVLVGADGIKSRVKLYRSLMLKNTEIVHKKRKMNSNLESVTSPNDIGDITYPHKPADEILNFPIAGESHEGLHIPEVVSAGEGTQKMHQIRKLNAYPPPALNYLNICVILGISTHEHPLLARQGFYVLDGKHRLFTMPFRNAKEFSSLPDYLCADGELDANAAIKTQELSESNQPSTSPAQTMWQLSFSGISEADASALKSSSPEAIIKEALRRTEGWFNPVQEMIRGTIREEVWCTPLFDSDPIEPLTRDRGSRVVLVGDACHPMSMFKGQGANQALEDAPLFAAWMAKCRDTWVRRSKLKVDRNGSGSTRAEGGASVLENNPSE
eukprot:gene6037-7704_t